MKEAMPDQVDTENKYVLNVGTNGVEKGQGLDLEEEEQLTRILRKVSLVLLPLLFLVAVFAYLDKGNLSYAAIKLNPQLGFTPTDYGLASGLFYLGFGVGILPSSFMTVRYGARLWFGCITLAWGVISTCHALLHTRTAFFVLRILLGLAEAGGTTSGGHLLAQFYPQSRIALPFTVVVVSGTVSGIFAAPLAAGLMSMDGLGGLAGWQYLFILEGVPSVLLGLAMLVWLPSTPLSAWMLTHDERELLHRKVHVTPEAAAAARHPPRWRQLLGIVWKEAKRPLLWYFIAVGFLWVLSAMSMGSWLPILVSNMLSGTALSHSTSGGPSSMAKSAAGAAAAGRGGGSQATKAILLSGIPSLCASVAMLLTAWHADRVNEKNWHVAVPYLVGGVVLTLFTPLYSKASFAAGFAVLVVSVTFANAAAGVINSRVVAALETRHAAMGLAIYTAVLACLGGFSGPVIIGAMVERLGSFSQATIVMGVILACAGLLMAGLALWEARQRTSTASRHSRRGSSSSSTAGTNAAASGSAEGGAV